MDPYNPAGSSRFVDLHTSKDLLWTTRADRCHVNLVVGDSDWELGFCETIENALGHIVSAYVKNHGRGFTGGSTPRTNGRRWRRTGSRQSTTTAALAAGPSSKSAMCIAQKR